GEGYGTDLVVGTGPYELTEWPVNGTRVVKKFADYGGNNLDYAAPVEFDEIHFTPVQEASAAAIGLETGEFDFVIEIANSDIDRLDALDNIEVTSRDTIDFRWVGMNVQH